MRQGVPVVQLAKEIKKFAKREMINQPQVKCEEKHYTNTTPKELAKQMLTEKS